MDDKGNGIGRDRKMTVLIKKNLSSFAWKPLFDFMLKTEKNNPNYRF